MNEDSHLQDLEGVNDEMLIELLAPLAVLKEHKFAVPIHEDDVHQANRIE